MKKFLNIFLSFLLVSVASFTLVGCGGNKNTKPSTKTNTYTITINTNNDEYGSVLGAGTYSEGEHITMVAVPNEGYTFVCWSDQQNTQNPRTIKVRSDYTYTATFKKETEFFNLDSVGVYINPPIDENFATIKLDRLKICVDYSSTGKKQNPLDTYIIGGYNTKQTNFYENNGYNLYDYTKLNQSYSHQNPSIIYASKNELNLFEEKVNKHVYIDMNFYITLKNGKTFAKHTFGEFDVKPSVDGMERNLATVTVFDTTTYSFVVNIIANFVKI